MATGDGWSTTWTFLDGDWHEGNVPIIGVRSHAAWLGSMVFDGARAFEGVTPDLERHCGRVNASAQTMGLKPVVPVEQWLGLVRDGRGEAPVHHSRPSTSRPMTRRWISFVPSPISSTFASA